MKSPKLFTLLFFAILLWTLPGCNYNTSYIEGNRNRITEDRELDNFENIDITGNFNITLIQDEKHMATLMCSSNLTNYIMSEVQNNTLYISVPENISIKEDRSIDLNIHFKRLNKVLTKGNEKIRTSELITSKKLMFECIGSSKLHLNMNSNQVDFKFPGASSIYISGIVHHVNLNSSGAIQFGAFDCDVDNYNIVMNGAGNAKVKVNQSLKVQINGAGKLLYKGSPNKVISNIEGIGKVKRSE